MTLQYKHKETGKTYTGEEVVDWFIKVNKRWWDDPKNSFFRQASHIRSILLKSMNGEDEDDPDGRASRYCNNKFDNEWLPLLWRSFKWT